MHSWFKGCGKVQSRAFDAQYYDEDIGVWPSDCLKLDDPVRAKMQETMLVKPCSLSCYAYATPPCLSLGSLGPSTSESVASLASSVRGFSEEGSSCGLPAACQAHQLEPRARRSSISPKSRLCCR